MEVGGVVIELLFGYVVIVVGQLFEAWYSE